MYDDAVQLMVVLVAVGTLVGAAKLHKVLAAFWEELRYGVPGKDQRGIATVSLRSDQD